MDKDKMDSILMAAMLMGLSDDKEIKVSPLEMSVDVTPSSISFKMTSFKPMIKDLGEEGKAWVEETQSLVAPIMTIQTTKFAEIMKKRFHLDFESAKVFAPDGKSEVIKEPFKE